MEHWNFIVLLPIVIAMGCQSAPTPAPVPPPTVNQIATDVARAQAVAATLTAAAPTPLPPPTWTRVVPSAPPLPTMPPIIPTAVRLPTQPPPTPQPYFRLINRHSQKCLTARGINQEVVHATCGNSPDQQWYLPYGAYQVALESKSGICVAYNPSNTSNALYGVACSGPRPWTIEQFGDYYTIGAISIRLPHPHPTQYPLETGMYFQIRYQNDCVDVEGWNHNEGQRLIHTVCRDCRAGFDDDNQLWARYP